MNAKRKKKEKAEKEERRQRKKKKRERTQIKIVFEKGEGVRESRPTDEKFLFLRCFGFNYFILVFYFDLMLVICGEFYFFFSFFSKSSEVKKI